MDSPHTGGLPLRNILFAMAGGALVAFALASICLGGLRVATSCLPSFGYQAFSLSGSSMEPYAKPGDLVVVRLGEMPAEGRNMVFWSGSGRDAGMVFHRTVTEVLAENGGYVTKGDNNGSPDSGEVAYGDVVGSEVLLAPGAGWAAPRGDSDKLMVLMGVLEACMAAFCLMAAAGRISFDEGSRR